MDVTQTLVTLVVAKAWVACRAWGIGTVQTAVILCSRATALAGSAARLVTEALTVAAVAAALHRVASTASAVAAVVDLFPSLVTGIALRAAICNSPATPLADDVATLLLGRRRHPPGETMGAFTVVAANPSVEAREEEEATGDFTVVEASRLGVAAVARLALVE